MKRSTALILVTMIFITQAHAETGALKAHKVAAEQGDANAEFNVGLIYYDGRSVSEEGIWIEVMGEAIRRGSGKTLEDKILDAVVGNKRGQDSIAQAEQIWASMTRSEQRSLQRDPELRSLRDKIEKRNHKTAAKWLALAAERGNADAQYYLGVLYSKGEGVKKSDVSAVQWHRSAAGSGNAYAQSVLGDSYAFGIGVERDDQKAAEWYRKAAAQGDGTAQQLLECLHPATENLPAGTIVHSSAQREQDFTGCTWDREGKNMYYPTIVSYVNGSMHGRNTQWAGGPRMRTAWRRYSEESYVDGVKQGPALVWQHRTGQKSSEVNFVNGLEQGVMTRWHKDGGKASEVFFIDGKKEGPYILWYASGAKQQEGTYVNGETSGFVTTWYENGNKSEMTNMDGGYRSGREVHWYENGVVQSEGTTDKHTGVRFGPWTEYYETGQKKWTADHLWSRSTGKFQHARPELGYLKDPGRVYWTSWYESGQKQSEGLYVSFDPKYADTPQRSNMSNSRQGRWTDWDSDGNATQSCYKFGEELDSFGWCTLPGDSAATASDPVVTEISQDELIAHFEFESNGEDTVHLRSFVPVGRVSYEERHSGNNAAELGLGYLTVDAGPLKLTQPFTISVWVKYDAVPSDWGANKILSNSSVTYINDKKSYSGYWLDVIPSNAKGAMGQKVMHPRFYANTNEGDGDRNAYVANRPISVGEWNHLAVVFNGSQRRIYVNGKPAGVQARSRNRSRTPIKYIDESTFLVGKWHEWGKFKGQIDDLLIYSKLLNDAEILSIYLASNGRGET